jgi:hypothetical protein
MSERTAVGHDPLSTYRDRLAMSKAVQDINMDRRSAESIKSKPGMVTESSDPASPTTPTPERLLGSSTQSSELSALRKQISDLTSQVTTLNLIRSGLDQGVVDPQKRMLQQRVDAWMQGNGLPPGQGLSWGQNGLPAGILSNSLGKMSTWAMGRTKKLISHDRTNGSRE